MLAAAADWPAGIATLRRASLRWTYLGIGLLLLEGVVTALRFRVLVRGRVRISSCLLANAWSVLLLLVLPARLGEVASVGAIVRYMDQPGGVAVASLLFQRVFDLILLAGLLVLLTILSAGEGP
ncbi:MAG: flippase-like domain-containing protein, partial [Gammaproteobacteria bacterium]|nr:flippase-like domain-containing protein [Gammaproteobacteria bacterium]